MYCSCIPSLNQKVRPRLCPSFQVMRLLWRSTWLLSSCFLSFQHQILLCEENITSIILSYLATSIVVILVKSYWFFRPEINNYCKWEITDCNTCFLFVIVREAAATKQKHNDVLHFTVIPLRIAFFLSRHIVDSINDMRVCVRVCVCVCLYNLQWYDIKYDIKFKCYNNIFRLILWNIVNVQTNRTVKDFYVLWWIIFKRTWSNMTGSHDLVTWTGKHCQPQRKDEGAFLSSSFPCTWQ